MGSCRWRRLSPGTQLANVSLVGASGVRASTLWVSEPRELSQGGTPTSQVFEPFSRTLGISDRVFSQFQERSIKNWKVQPFGVSEALRFVSHI